MPTETALADYLDFLRFASISADPAYQAPLDACADWLVQKLNAIGLETTKHAIHGPAVIVARGPQKAGRPTVLIYGHYDVQPVDPLALWKHPPFAPYVEEGYVYARGAMDNKGQIFAHILGVEETLRTSGDLPVNLIFLIEGEEEVGSIHLPDFLAANRANLACDVVAISDGAMLEVGHPTLTYGLRGLFGMELTVTGPDKDLHSGSFGGAVENPATVLARLIASLHDADLRVQVPGFYDDVLPVQEWERVSWRQLPMQESQLLKLSGAPALRGEAGYSALERIWARPTAEVNGIGSGYQGEGGKTVLPSRAQAKLTFRLVPNQKVEEVTLQILAHLQSNTPPSVHLECNISQGADAYLVDPQLGYGLAAQRALQRLNPGTPPALTRTGGSIPIVITFKTCLGVDSLLLDLGLYSGNAHSPNENHCLEHLDLGARLNQFLLEELARA